MCLCKVGTRSSVVINQSVLISGVSYKRSSTVMAVVLGCIIVLVVDHIPSTGILLCPPGPHQGICGVSLCQL